MDRALKLVHSSSSKTCQTCTVTSAPACLACDVKPDLHLLLRNLQRLQTVRPSTVAAVVVFLNDQLKRYDPP